MIFAEKKTCDDKIDIRQMITNQQCQKKPDSFLPPTNEVCEGYDLHLSVILFTRGVSASVHAGIHTPWEQTHSTGADTPRSRHPWEQTPPRSRHPPGADTPLPGADQPPVQCMLGDTGNKQVVRILLECILVIRIKLAWRYLVLGVLD